MKALQIPSTDLTITPICLGTGSFGTRNSEAQAFALLDFFTKQGGNFLDTARIYSDWVPGEIGRVERILGDWLRTNGMHGKTFVATKGGHPELLEGALPRLSEKELGYDINLSLEKLGGDSLDMYYLHRDDTRLPVGEIMENLNVYVKKGLVRNIGCSNWDPLRIREAIVYARDHGLKSFTANQPLWNYGSDTMKAPADSSLYVMDREGIEMHTETGIAAIPFSSQANGYFGKILSDDPAELQKAKDGNYHNAVNATKAKTLMQRVTTELPGATPIQLSLLWLYRHPFPVIPTIGGITREQIKESMGALDLLEKKIELA